MKPNPKPYADQSKAGLNHVEQNSSLDWPYTNDPKQKTTTPKYPKKTAPPEGAGGAKETKRRRISRSNDREMEKQAEQLALIFP